MLTKDEIGMIQATLSQFDPARDDVVLSLLEGSGSRRFFEFHRADLARWLCASVLAKKVADAADTGAAFHELQVAIYDAGFLPDEMRLPENLPNAALAPVPWTTADGISERLDAVYDEAVNVTLGRLCKASQIAHQSA